MKVTDVMTREVQTVAPDHSVQEAAAAMLSSDAGSIPVTENGRLIGMITDRDIAVRGVAKGHGPETLVREIMTRDLVVVRSDESLDQAATKMSAAQVRRLPVIDEQEQLCGIISLGDLSRQGDNGSANEALEGVSKTGGSHRQ